MTTPARTRRAVTAGQPMTREQVAALPPDTWVLWELTPACDSPHVLPVVRRVMNPPVSDDWQPVTVMHRSDRCPKETTT